MEETAQSPPSVTDNSHMAVLIGVMVTILLLMVGLVAVLFSKIRQEASTLAPRQLPVPTVSPFTVSGINQDSVSSSQSAESLPVGRLAFIRGGDIYHSDLSNASLLVKTATPAGDLLMWSPKGTMLSWRPKTLSGTGSRIAVYRRDTGHTSVYDFSPFEVTDVSWSQDESSLAVVVRAGTEELLIVPSSYVPAEPRVSLVSAPGLSQSLWLSNGSILYRWSQGISRISDSSASARLIVSETGVADMILSPDQSKLLYRITNGEQHLWFIISVEEGDPVALNPEASRINMGNLGISASALDKGFDSKAIWFPKSNKILMSYQYASGFSLVGIYAVNDSSFTALAPFYLSNRDILVDDTHLVGARVNTTGQNPGWQIVLYTMEDGAKLAVSQVIPDGLSPAFYRGD